MTLTQKELMSVISILAEESASTFDVIANALHHYFEPNDYFRLGTGLVSIFLIQTIHLSPHFETKLSTGL